MVHLLCRKSTVIRNIKYNMTSDISKYQMRRRQTVGSDGRVAKNQVEIED